MPQMNYYLGTLMALGLMAASALYLLSQAFDSITHALGH
jgi:hypothetical protein